MHSAHCGESESPSWRWVSHYGPHQVDHRGGEQRRQLVCAASSIDHLDHHAHRPVGTRARIGGHRRPAGRLDAPSRTVAAHGGSVSGGRRIGDRRWIPRVHGTGAERRLERSGTREKAMMFGAELRARGRGVRDVRRVVRFDDAHTDIDGPSARSVPVETREQHATRSSNDPETDIRPPRTLGSSTLRARPQESARTSRKDGDWNTRWRPG